jgi:hypothetical protein
MNSFGINSVKSYDGYFGIKTILKKFELQSYKSRRVLQLWYTVRFHRTSYEKVMKFFVQSITARAFSRTDRDIITVGSSKKKLATMTQYHCRFKPKTDSDDPNIIVGWSYHCRFKPLTGSDGSAATLSLSVCKKPITAALCQKTLSVTRRFVTQKQNASPIIYP